MPSILSQGSFNLVHRYNFSFLTNLPRGELNCQLMNLLERNPNVQIYFNRKCTGLNLKNGEIQLRDEVTQNISTFQAQTTLGCDGAFSVIRRSIMQRTDRFNYSQEYIDHGYKELTIPSGSGGVHQLDARSLHIWPRASFMMIALPNLDGSFTVTCFFPFEGSCGFNRLDHCDDVALLQFFQTYFPDAVPLMPNLVHDFRRNQTSSLLTVRCTPWSVENKCCLFGDAAHAIVPFFGQGMNCAFEDCAVFDQVLDEQSQSLLKIDWKGVFQRYQLLRKDNADAIASMALENFVEMRDRVADPHFLLMQKVNRILGLQFPMHFLSRYELVSFTRIPYKKAMERGKMNDQIVCQLLQETNENGEIDLKKARKLIETLLPPLDLQLKTIE